MKQFREAYAENKKVSALRTQLSWTSHYMYLSKVNSAEERVFYVHYCAKERVTSRELNIRLTVFYSNAIAEYTTKLPDKKLLQTKLHEFFNSSVYEMETDYRKVDDR